MGQKKPSSLPHIPPVKELNIKMNITAKRMTDIFNEWAKRYSKKPDEFTNILDDNGKPVKDYGESCTRYFSKLNDEMDKS